MRLCILAIPFWKGNQHLKLLRLLLLQHLLCHLSGLLRNLKLDGLLCSHYSDALKGQQQSVLTGAYLSRANTTLSSAVREITAVKHKARKASRQRHFLPPQCLTQQWHLCALDGLLSSLGAIIRYCIRDAERRYCIRDVYRHTCKNNTLLSFLRLVPMN